FHDRKSLRSVSGLNWRGSAPGGSWCCAAAGKASARASRKALVFMSVLVPHATVFADSQAFAILPQLSPGMSGLCKCARDVGAVGAPGRKQCGQRSDSQGGGKQPQLLRLPGEAGDRVLLLAPQPGAEKRGEHMS